MLATGTRLCRHYFRLLGPKFTATVMVRHGQPIVQRGAYRWIRHPCYTGAMLVVIGSVSP